MPETATRLPRSRTPRNPAWLDAVKVYQRSFNATSPDTLDAAADAFAEMPPDDQVFHQAHLALRQVEALGDVHAVLCRIEARLGALSTLKGLRGLPTIKNALVSIARGQNKLVRIVSEGGLAEAVRGDNDDDDDDDGDEEDDDLDGDDADLVEDEDHGNGDPVETVVAEVIPAGARRPAPEAS